MVIVTDWPAGAREEQVPMRPTKMGPATAVGETARVSTTEPLASTQTLDVMDGVW